MQSQRPRTAIIHVACGFARKPHYDVDSDAVSSIDKCRSVYTVEHYEQGDSLFVTGMVPYDASAPLRTLANLNAYRLNQVEKLRGVPIQLVPGLNAFSESWNACMLAHDQGAKQIIVVVSDFYLSAYRRMWLAAGKRNGLDVEIVEVRHKNEVDQSVWAFYQGPKAQILSKVAASSWLGHWLAKMLADRMTKRRRTEGFKLDGHTSIG
jgi:hypothetical protein